MRYVLFFILELFVFFNTLSGQELTNQRAEWFTHSRFGMFIHWGVYSAAEGIWKGEKLRNDNDYAEWIQYRNRIDKEEYITLLDRFDWDHINPEEWVLLAKKSGMKYVTITAKHHDGFGLWDSKVSDYDLGDFTNPKRDIIKEIAIACDKHGLKLGLYYSHWVDWEHEFGWDHTKELTGITEDEYDVYWQNKVIPQIRELLTNYGPIGLIWFDMWTHHSHTVVTKEQLLQLKKLIRELQPDCLVNSRLGLSVSEDSDVDFQTLGDNELGNTKKAFPWQSPATVAHSWGYHALDTQWKSTTSLLKALINNVSLNGNFMLNIGPRANGKVPYEISHRMLAMGKWLDINGTSIYGAEGFDLKKDQHDWGKITCKLSETENRLFLHVFNWPLDHKLTLTGIKTCPDKIYLLSDNQKTPLEFDHNTLITRIKLPAAQPDPYISVIVAEYNKRPQIENGLVAKTSDNGYSLTFENQAYINKQQQVKTKERGGTIPGHVLVSSKERFKWRIFIEDPQELECDISYSYQEAESRSKFVLHTEKNSITLPATYSGKTIGEPNTNWIIDNFKCERMGKIYFSEQGIYNIELDVIPGENENVKFQWLWIK